MTNATQLKTGKKPATYSPKDLTFEELRVEDIAPTVPSADKDNIKLIADWGMLGNDQYGDCVFAGGDHETMMDLIISGKIPASEALQLFTDQTALGDYGRVTGFTPDDPNSDQGTDVRTALSYRRRTGLADSTGHRHKIGAYVALQPGDRSHVREAIHLFDQVGIGFECPQSIMTQFEAGKPWSIVPGSPVEGGHYVPVVGYDYHYLYVVTWGRIQKMTWGFFRKYCDEAWAILGPEFLKDGESPEGFDLATLTNFINSL